MPKSGIGERLRRWHLLPPADPVPSGHSFDDRLAAVLSGTKHVDTTTLEQAQRLAEQTRRPLGATLLDLGVVSPEQLCAAYVDVTGLPMWSGRGEFVDQPTFSPDFLIYNRVFPVRFDGRTCFVIADVEDDGLIDMIRRLAPDSDVAIAPEDELAYRLERQFGLSESEADAAAHDLSDVQHLKDLALEAPIVRQLNDIIYAGIKMGASDIHMEPYRHRVELRYRLDGVLQSRPAPQPDDYPAITSRLKILSGLDIAERRLPQDGRYKIRFAGQDVDIRVSTIPTPFGEDVVLRLLNQKKQLLSLDALGLSSDVVQPFRQVLRRSHGLILVTGPTGSGKTTSLYAGLKDIIDGEKKIVTVEDPVEYEIPGISQIQVHADIGLTFASTLRSILRHDPDVILVGEIRDRDTAEIAVQAALTGHLVLSTIHTNDAVSAIGRLLNIGVADYLVASSLVAVTGQRLVRRLCVDCRRESKIDPETAVKFGLAPGLPIYEPVGCHTCNGTGYLGRLPIGEFLTIGAAVRETVLTNPTVDALFEKAAVSGFRPMLADGFTHVAAGSTTVEEVLRVAG